MDERTIEILKELKEFTKECRPSMHEPDEQDIEARVVGDHLDNAFGNNIRQKAVEDGYQEYVIVLRKGTEQFKINLADLIALARYEKED